MKVLLIYTGGTIGMKRDEKRGVLVPFDFSAIYDEMPYLKRLDVSIDVHTLEPIIDSSNVKPENWVHIAELLRDSYEKYDGFVVLHGTDTMSYTASALSFMLENLAKPVVFTGSQIPMGVLRSDGRENLITAIEIAASYHDGRANVPEVCLYFQNNLYRANRSTKRSTEALTAFRSYNYPPLAEVGVNIVYHNSLIAKTSDTVEPLRITTNLSSRVATVALFPGLSTQMLAQMVDNENIDGVVLQTYGAGNAPTDSEFLGVIERAVSRGVLILNVTQCLEGAVEMGIYDTGMQLQNAGVLCGKDLSLEAALTKMMYVLGLCGDDRAKAKKMLETSIRGEFSE